MKTFRVLLAAFVLSGISAAYSQTLLEQYQPGPRLINGSQLNKMVDQVNALTGAAGTAGPISASTLTTGAIKGSDSSLGIDGQATAQGGAIAITGGTSSTTGNAGGAVTILGGTPGLTGLGGAAILKGGVGGATNKAGGAATVVAGAGQGTGDGAIASVTGGASGAGTTGTGGVASVTGGASAATNGAGGAASLVGGLGKGTQAGGAIAITGGAGGSTGLGGAVAITAGAPTAAAGSSVTITATAGAGSTNSGGSVNLVPGAAVSTGIPGKVQVNGDANLMCATYHPSGTPAATNQVFYIVNRPMIVTSISNIFSTAAGGTSTLDITKESTTGAPGTGTVLGTAAFNLNATANTVQNATLSATIATITMAAGDRLSVKYNHAIQSSAGVVVTACMSPL